MESQENTVTFPEISTPILEKVVEYFYYKVRYAQSSDIPGDARCPSLSSLAFVRSNACTEFKIEPENALELLMAANFLDA
eukprot:751782-Hanusia_phi.AAC.6